MRTLLSAISVILLMAVLAACVGSQSADDAADDEEVAVAEDPTPTLEPDEPDPTATPEPEPTETPEAAETPEPAATDDDAVSDDAEVDDTEAAEPVEHIVEIRDPHNFEPDELVIAAGDTVTFVNNGQINHTATLDPEIARDPDNAVLPEGAEPWDSGDLEPDDEFSITLDVPGEYVYFCRPHEVLGQVATIIVNGDDVDTDDDDTADVDDGSDDDGESDDEADDYL